MTTTLLLLYVPGKVVRLESSGLGRTNQFVRREPVRESLTYVRVALGCKSRTCFSNPRLIHAQSPRDIRAHLCTDVSIANRPSGGLPNLAVRKRAIRCRLGAVFGVECRPGCRDMPLYAAICRSLERKSLIFLGLGFFFASQLRWRSASRAKLAREPEGRGLRGLRSRRLLANPSRRAIDFA